MARRMPGVSTGNDVYRWEAGKHLPRADTLEAIAALFEIEVADLYAGPVPDEPPQRPTPEEADAAFKPEARSESELVEQIRETNSELAEVRGELSEVRTDLQRQGLLSLRTFMFPEPMEVVS